MLRKLPLRKLRPVNLLDTLRVNFSDSILVARWASSKTGTQNFGDVLNHNLIELLSGRSVVNYDDVFLFSDRPVYSVIGSVLNNLNFGNAVVWGSGFMNDTDRLWIKPKEVLAVRGPLSRNVFLKHGASCPPLYGDPALLCPRYYRFNEKKQFDLGIIPHYVDLKSDKLNQILNSGISCKLIDVTSGVEKVIRDILSCRHIASSSLHGLIVAEAYKIPSVWLKFGDKIKGGNFKFDDYYASIGEPDVKPFQLEEQFSKELFWDSFSEKRLDIDLDALLKACPFKKAGA